MPGPAGEIEDRQARVHEPAGAVDEKSLVSWAAVAQPVAQSGQIGLADVVLTIRVKDSGNAAHELGGFWFVAEPAEYSRACPPHRPVNVRVRREPLGFLGVM